MTLLDNFSTIASASTIRCWRQTASLCAMETDGEKEHVHCGTRDWETEEVRAGHFNSDGAGGVTRVRERHLLRGLT
jgi:hypothetical protein